MGEGGRGGDKRSEVNKLIEALPDHYTTQKPQGKLLNVSLSNACTNSRKIHAKPTLQPSATVPAPYPELRESVGAVSRKTVPTELVQIVQNPHRQLTQPAAEGKSSYVSVADRIRRFTRLRSRGIIIMCCGTVGIRDFLEFPAKAARNLMVGVVLRTSKAPPKRRTSYHARIRRQRKGP